MICSRQPGRTGTEGTNIGIFYPEKEKTKKTIYGTEINDFGPFGPSTHRIECPDRRVRKNDLSLHNKRQGDESMTNVQNWKPRKIAESMLWDFVIDVFNAETIGDFETAREVFVTRMATVEPNLAPIVKGEGLDDVASMIVFERLKHGADPA